MRQPSPSSWSELREGQQVPLAIVSIDLAGWTAFAEEAGAEAGGLLSTFRGQVAGAVRQFQGLLGAWAGDGTCAVFLDGDGAGCERAVRCALDVRERYRTELPDAPPARTAVHAGVVRWAEDLGEIASDDWNHVGHLQEDTPPGEVLVSEDVYDSLPAELRRPFRLLGGHPRPPGIICFVTGRGPGAGTSSFSDARQRRTHQEYVRTHFAGLDLRGLVPAPPMTPPPVEEVYVPVRLVRHDSRDPEPPSEGTDPDAMGPRRRVERVPESLESLLGREHRLVVLGSPGAGKTTLVRYLGHTAARGRQALRRALGVDQRRVPVVVPLATWARRCLDDAETPLDGLALVVDESGCGFGREGLCAALERGEAWLLFDGLDEVGDGTRRVRASRLVEELLRAFPRAASLVTSRPRGFAGLAAVAGPTFRLDDWGEPEVERYVTALLGVLSPGEDAAPLLEALHSNARLASLVRTPLLATLAVLVCAGGRGHLPESRAELYDHVLRALVETWDRLRSLSAGRSAARVRYAAELKVLARVALCLFERSGVDPVTPRRLRRVAEEVLEARSGPGTDVGEAADAFVQRYVEDRHLFVDRGEDLLSLHHSALHEYLAARGILLDGTLGQRLTDHGDDPRWAEVLRLALFWRAWSEGHDGEVAELVEAFRIGEASPGWRQEAEAVLRTRLVFALGLLGDSPGLPEATARTWVEAALDHGFAEPTGWQARWLGAALDGLADSEAGPALAKGLLRRTTPVHTEEDFQRAFQDKDRTVANETERARHRVWALGHVRRLPSEYVRRLVRWHGSKASMVQAAIDEALVRGSSLTPPEFTRMYLARRLRPGSWAGRLGTLATPFQRDPATAAWAVKRIRGDRPIWHWPVVADVLLGAALALPSCEELLEELRELANEPGPGAALAPLVLLALGEPNLPDVAAVRQALATSSLPDAEEVLSSLAAASLQIRSLLPDLLPEEGDRWNTLRAALGDGADVAAALVSQPEWRFPEPLVRARCRTEPDFPDPFAVAAIALGGESGYRLLRRLDPAPEPLRERLAGEVGAADDPWVVAGCLHALCGVAPEPVVERAADLVASDQWVVRKNALALLLSMGETGRILPARAVELTADEAEAVRAAAAWVAADVCAADPGPAAAALLEALDRPVESLVYLLGTVLTAPEHAYLALESLVARAGP